MLDKETSREVRSKIRAILMADWDPIGVNDVPDAADEYDSTSVGLTNSWSEGPLKNNFAHTCDK